MAHPFTIGVFGIIKDEQNRVLLVLRNDYEFWNLPGGGLEKGEAPREGVVREVKEETGFDVKVKQMAGIYSKENEDDLVIVFECEVISGKITLNEEAKDIQFFSFDKIPKNTPPKQLERVKDFLENSDKFPIMKKQGGLSQRERFKQFSS